MYCGGAVIVLLYLILWLLSRREEPLSLADFSGKKTALPAGIGRMAVYLYKRACILGLPFFRSARVRRDLERLYPGQAPERLEAAYYVDKLGLCLVIALAGTILAVAVSARTQSDFRLSENVVSRGAPGEADSTILLEASDGDGNAYAYQVEVASRRLTRAEAEECLARFREMLPELISGENDSLENVTRNLILTDSYEGFPFAVQWESGRPELVDKAGIVSLPEDDAGEAVLKAVVSYEEYEWELELSVMLYPPVLTSEERRQKTLEAQLKRTERDSRSEDGWSLPGEWEGSPLVWRQQVRDHGFLVLLLALATAAAIYLMKDRDLHSDLEKRRAQMRRDYPDVVHKLVLFLGAGMTLRGAFSRIVAEYEQDAQNTKSAQDSRNKKNTQGAENAQGMQRARGEIRYVYEEMRYACRELQTGVSEGAVYERFGKRIGLQEYIRLSTLLSQNLKKGSTMLLPRLQEEAQKASEERMQLCRQLGEEAVTKLLVPMVMMLLVAMVMIIFPAFSSVGM